MKGKVYLVGCGPGSPDYLTLRAKRVIEKADTILYDRLIDEEILEFSDDAEKIYVGKKSGESSKQEKINKLMLEKASEGKDIARLKNGDPMVFGRGGEELGFLRKNSINVQVIPGVSSAIGLPSLNSIPLTERDISSNLSIHTGVKKGGEKPDFNGVGDTAIVLMTVGNLENVVENLIKNGKSKDVNSAIISSGTFTEERILSTSLEKIPGLAREVEIKPPAILVAGEVVKKIINPEGREVAIFRPKVEKNRTENLIEESGGFAKFFGICDTKRTNEEKLKNLLREKWDAIAFSSPNGVRKTKEFIDFSEFKIISIGERTKEVLESSGANEIILPNEHSTDGIEKLLEKKDWKTLAIRSNMANSQIQGAKNITSYKIKPLNLEKNLKKYLESNPDFTIFTSSGMIKMIMEKASEKELEKKIREKIESSFLISIGRKTTKTALDSGLKVNFEMPEPELEKFFRV